MNQKVKGAMAAAAGGILLLGGLGSYALWEDSENIGGGPISSGELSIDPVGTPTWEDVSDITPGPIADISNFLIVPGDVLEYHASYMIAASGDNLKATLTADQAGITGDPALLAHVSSELAVTGLADGGSAGVYTVTDADAGSAIDVVVTLTFDRDTPDQVAQNEAINLADFNLALQQVRP
ncbi:alternate-type signal peptide domain-containing protein [Skermania piniformis]|uniref:Alternate-type signal peptide domain-containing protein n=1 Tax=Skermania pinensis TaxID=39122 RepID=A0ABX8SGH0_9ACTN|nr:alternate-type signal peptide domain-containing protein [Skermania piniformis]QXQ14776.1 alternate-type signal peptide domain-containing protein [Skermania piniformis]